MALDALLVQSNRPEVFKEQFKKFIFFSFGEHPGILESKFYRFLGIEHKVPFTPADIQSAKDGDIKSIATVARMAGSDDSAVKATIGNLIELKDYAPDLYNRIMQEAMDKYLYLADPSNNSHVQALIEEEKK